MDNVFHLRRRTIDYGSYRGGDTNGKLSGFMMNFGQIPEIT